MASVGYATLEVIPSLKGIESKLTSGLTGPMSSTGKKAGTTLGDGIKGSMGTAAKGIALSIGSAFAAVQVTDFFKDAIGEAREAEVVTARTANVIKSMGGVAGVTSKQVADLAGAISSKVGIDDEAIQSGQNLLLTFGNLRNEAGKGNDVFDQTTGLMVDMSVAMDQDMKSSAVQLGKALNDPIKGVSALSRVGVSFTEQQTTQIKKMAETNDLLGAQKIILGEVKKQFGGAGEAMADPAERAKVAFGNLKEQIGTELLPTVNRITNWFTDEGVPAVSDFITEFEKGRGVGGDVRDVLEDVGGAVQSAAGFAGDFVGWFRDMPDWAQKMLAGGAVGGLALGKLQGSPLGAAAGVAAIQKVYVTNMPVASPGAAGGGKGGVSPFWPVAAATIIAPGVFSETQAMIKGASDDIRTSVESIKDSLSDSNVGKNAEEFGIDVDRLAVDIARFGDEGKYFKEVMGNLTSDTGLKAFAEAFGSGIIPGWHSGIEKADDATKDLLDTIDGVKQADNRKWFMGLIRGTESANDKGRTLAETIMGVDRQKPTVDWAFPGLTDGIKRTDGLGKDTDKVGKKKPSVPWYFPNLLGGIGDVERLGDKLRGTEGTRTATVRVDGVTKSIADLNALQARINSMEGKTIFNTVRTIGGPQAAGVADGGTVLGSRYPYGDKVPAMLAPGEEVISNRNGQADRYRSILKAINAGRYADGGTVGRGAGSSVPGMAGGRVELTITNWDTGTGYMRYIAEDEYSVQSAHEARIQGMRGRAT